MRILIILIIVGVGITGVLSGILISNIDEFTKTPLQENDSMIVSLDDNPITPYNIDTECKALLSLYDLSLQKKTINQIADLETLLEKYPIDGEIIRQYTFDSIESNNTKNIPNFQSLPPTVLNSLINIMTDTGSVDPTLKPFLRTVLSGEITRDEIIQIFVNDNTQCEKELAPYLTTIPPSV